MSEMRKCKECGKLFQPKGREQYCSEIHYRPCPICGTLVVAKYLSDPPRRCANCKANNKILPKGHSKLLFDIQGNQPTDIKKPTSKKSNVTASSKASNESSVSKQSQQLNIEIPSGKDIRRYVGKDYKKGKGFRPNHLYELDIQKDEYSYILSAVYDWTDNKEVAITELFSSKISIDGHFKKFFLPYSYIC